MSAFDWQDVLMDEENGLPLDAVKEDLPSKNEEKGEDNGQGSPAAGALPEDDDPKGMKDAPKGKDLISGQNPSEYDDLMNLFRDEEEEEAEPEKDDKAEEKEDKKEEKKEEEEAEESEEDEKGTSDEAFFDSLFADEENGLKVDPAKEDLPDENEKKGEDNGQGSEAAGDLSEDDDPKGMKDVPTGKNLIGGDDYDDLMNLFLDKDDKEEEKKEDDKEEKKEKGEDKGSDDDGASEDAPVEGEGKDKKKEEDDEEITDFASFFADADTVVPEANGTKLTPPDPVDGDGKAVCPCGDPDLPANLTEPVIVPGDKETKDEFLDELRNVGRFAFGDF